LAAAAAAAAAAAVGVVVLEEVGRDDNEGFWRGVFASEELAADSLRFCCSGVVFFFFFLTRERGRPEGVVVLEAALVGDLIGVRAVDTLRETMGRRVTARTKTPWLAEHWK
jgi:hypothetical protein